MNSQTQEASPDTPTNRHYNAYLNHWHIAISEVQGSTGAIWRFYIGTDLKACGKEPSRPEAFARADHHLKVYLKESLFPGGPKAL